VNTNEELAIPLFVKLLWSLLTVLSLVDEIKVCTYNRQLIGLGIARGGVGSSYPDKRYSDSCYSETSHRVKGGLGLKKVKLGYIILRCEA